MFQDHGSEGSRQARGTVTQSRGLSWSFVLMPQGALECDLHRLGGKRAGLLRPVSACHRPWLPCRREEYTDSLPYPWVSYPWIRKANSMGLASLDFGISGDPGTNTLEMPRDDCNPPGLATSLHQRAVLWRSRQVRALSDLTLTEAGGWVNTSSRKRSG